MKLIPLTQGKFAKVDDSDYPMLTMWKWSAFKRPGRKGEMEWFAVRGEPRGNKKYRTIYMHRQIAAVPHLPCVDHRDHDTLNNQRSNLRPCSYEQNNANTRKRKHGNTSKYKGVYWHKEAKKWAAMIRFKGRGHHLGCFFDEAMAALAYRLAAEKVWGEFANFG